MTKQVEVQPERKISTSHYAVLCIVLIIPGLMPLAFGWLYLLLPLLAFLHIEKFGRDKSYRVFIPMVVAAFIIGVVVQRFEAILFAVMLPPTGLLISQSANKGEAPWRSGLKGWLFLSALFFLFSTGHTLFGSSSFFATITAGIHSAIDQSLNEYRNFDGISAENYAVVEQTLLQVKNTAPLFLPAIFGSGLLMIAWTTIVLGNVLLPVIGRPQPWPSYRYWKLPDILIWAVIIASLSVVIPNKTVQIAGWNCLLLLATLYFFQGLAIAAYYLHSWKLPTFFRVVLYLMLVLQTFGTVLLIVVGIIDVWFDMRRLSSQKQNRNSQTD